MSSAKVLSRGRSSRVCPVETCRDGQDLRSDRGPPVSLSSVRRSFGPNEIFYFELTTGTRRRVISGTQPLALHLHSG